MALLISIFPAWVPAPGSRSEPGTGKAKKSLKRGSLLELYAVSSAGFRLPKGASVFDEHKRKALIFARVDLKKNYRKLNPPLPRFFSILISGSSLMFSKK